MPTRDDWLTARVTTEERFRVDLAAGLRRLSRSEYQRRATLRAAERDLELAKRGELPEAATRNRSDAGGD